MATLTSFEELGKKFDTYTNNIYNSTEAKVKAISNKVAEFVIQSTPIDRGTARYAWQTSIDKEPSSPIIDKRQSPPVDNPAMDAINRNKSETALFKIDVNKRIYIVNYLDYMLELNRGWSNQAPANFVAGSVTAAIIGTKGVRISASSYGGSYGK